MPLKLNTRGPRRSSFTLIALKNMIEHRGSFLALFSIPLGEKKKKVASGCSKALNCKQRENKKPLPSVIA